MNPIFNTHHPDGFSTVNTYLFVENPPELIDFLKTAFYAEEINRTIHATHGDIANCILQIGDTCFMISQARGKFSHMKTALYLFVDDVDAMYQRALEHGATSEFAPADMPYQERQGGIVDPCGNYWWISKRLTKEGYQN